MYYISVKKELYVDVKKDLGASHFMISISIEE